MLSGSAPVPWREAIWALLIAAQSVVAADVGDRVAQAVESAKIGRARVGVSVVDLSTGRTLASVDEAGRYIPASNMKLLTSGAALTVLGEDFTFRTEFRRSGDRLVVVGSGDPALADPDLLGRLSPPMTVEDVLGRFAGAVAADGGRFSEVVVDDRIFDTQFVHPSWPADQLNRWYCAEVGGINFHTNTLSVFPRPGREGEGRPPELTVEPRCDWIPISTGSARTALTGTTNVWLSRAPGANRFDLHGQVTNPVKEAIPVTIHDPPLFFAEILADRLRARGVDCGPARRASDSDPPGGRVLAVATTHIQDVLSRCNADSYNLYAEALIKRMGHDISGEPGSWSNGAAVVRMVITEAVGAEAGSDAVISDGSGMSRENRVTPRLMTAWLGALQKKTSVGETFLASMAGPGEATLRNRFEQRAPVNTLQAKTGYIRGVRCLSGYLTATGSQRRIAFSILINDLKGENDAAGKRLQETIVLAIDDWLSAQAPAQADAQPAGRR